MNKIGQYDYPTETTFSETLEVANDALNRFGGFMPNLAVTQKLGYNYKKATGISGWVYRRFDEMCVFGLFARERGGIRTTDLTRKALDPYDKANATAGKVEAISKVPLFAKALAEWKGGMPDADAFPAKLGELASVDWVEAKKHSDVLQKLISDCFSYAKQPFEVTTTLLGASLTPVVSTGGNRGTPFGETRIPTQEADVTGPFGELRTLVGTVVIKNMPTLRLARSTLDVLEDEIKEQEAKAKKPAKEASKQEKE